MDAFIELLETIDKDIVYYVDLCVDIERNKREPLYTNAQYNTYAGKLSLARHYKELLKQAIDLETQRQTYDNERCCHE